MATCAPTVVREGGKIGRDENPLDCSAEKHCGYLPLPRDNRHLPQLSTTSEEVSLRIDTTLSLSSEQRFETTI